METTRFTRHGLRRSFLISQQESLDLLSRLRDPKAEYEAFLRELNVGDPATKQRCELPPRPGGVASRAA